MIMNRVQLAMARQIFGWPLYTIIIALGQASPFFRAVLARWVLTCVADVGCQQLSGHTAHGTKLSGQPPALRPRWYFPSLLVCVGHPVLAETIRLCALRSLAVLWSCFLLDRHPFVSPLARQHTHYHLGYRYLVLCYFFCRCVCVLWVKLWRGSGEYCPLSWPPLTRLTRFIGCCHRDLGAACVHCTGVAADLDCGPVVLGKHPQRCESRQHDALVDRIDSLAIGIHVLLVRVPHVVRPSRYVGAMQSWGCLGMTCFRLLSSDAAQSAQLFQDAVPAKAGFMVSISVLICAVRPRLMFCPRFLASEILRDYWLSGVRIPELPCHVSSELITVGRSRMAETGVSSGTCRFPNGKSYCSSSDSSSASGLS